MIDWLHVGAAVLGAAVLIHALTAFAEARTTLRRQRYVLLRQVTNDLEYFIALALALATRARQVELKYAAQLAGPGYPDPAGDDDSLPESARETSAWLVARAHQLAAHEVARDLDRVAGTLDRVQADALFAVLEARRVYLEVLTTRAMDLAAFPRRPGVLKRFVGVAELNVGRIRELLEEFAVSLELPPPDAPMSID